MITHQTTFRLTYKGKLVRITEILNEKFWTYGQPFATFNEALRYAQDQVNINTRD